MSDTESTDENTEDTGTAEATPEPAYGNPQPPYDVPLPEEYEDTPFEDLPEGLQHRVQRLAEGQGPHIGGSDTTTGGSVDPSIAPPDTAGTV